jgi:NAD(P)-dependent dehydrogenase (short-subunit alcohol dehydrogenase family)
VHGPTGYRRQLSPPHHASGAGAGNEIGHAVIERLRAEGAQVIAADLVGTGPGGVVVDFRDEEPVAAFFARVEREHRRLDVRFNNMGRMDPADADILLYSGMVLRRSSRRREGEIRLTLSRGQGVAWTS